MASDREKVRLVFGLKVRQLRTELGLSTYDLADQTGLSPSYLNEIEKGKKYPKTEKIFALAKALQTDYDSLVSLRVSKQLEPVVELFDSNILNELPLDLFGIEPGYFLEVMANAPAKLSALISTLIEIGRNYDLRVEQFYFSVLRTYQAMHDNYFEDLELEADQFLSEHPLPSDPTHCPDWLFDLLTHTYGCTIQTYDAAEQPDLAALRSVYLPEKNTLLLNRQLSNEQRAFTLAREIGYRRLKATIRPLESSVLSARSFEEVFNNFRASYFARAVLIPRQRLINELTEVAASGTWSNNRLLDMMLPFAVTPEMFLLRMTNVLTSHFGLKELFFIRFNQGADGRYTLNKELHLSKLHTPHGTARNEHYCRRQVSVTILTELRQLQQSGAWNGQPICRAQQITFSTNGNTYFVFSIAKSSPPTTTNSSINIGFPLTPQLREVFRFLDDPAIPSTSVGETCERCPIADCTVRAAPPVERAREHQTHQTLTTIEKLRFG
ncbi:helix-turn-helix domain-containing protein [Rudanella paleaurantiibacter]|uniref:Helix-turn-helix domain-containing protein n=1 Tax=Rudanella paleaurantiibacter TaxID=2614655 RepID=A0A7J5TUH4_9BACT|nr:XRE family transcriptional regulator [Rudanella paleaurantiibacter]KAB7727617.1 helix-turn-helix domain-containing protein [Rudanella paleaurantiibacter]